jgi:hypothetical protein
MYAKYSIGGAGVQLLENSPLPPLEGREKISASVIWVKNIKRAREKGGKCKRKRKKGESKRENGKYNVKINTE